MTKKDVKTHETPHEKEQSDHASETKRIQVSEEPKKREESKEQTKAEPKKKRVYVHEPGTTHLSAYEAAVEEAKEKVKAAEDELNAAKQRLEEKKEHSQFEEVEE